MDNIEIILNQLKDNNFLNKDTLIKIDDEVFDFEGNKTDSSIFKKIKTKYAIYTYGKYSKEYSKLEKPLRSCTDDAAQMFGGSLKFVCDNIKSNCITKDGFVVVGRFINELIGSCILVEKESTTELLGKRIGNIHYLPIFLCEIEHFVYLKSYSQKGLKNE